MGRSGSRQQPSSTPLASDVSIYVRRVARATENPRNTGPPGRLQSVALGGLSVGVHRQNPDSRVLASVSRAARRRRWPRTLPIRHSRLGDLSSGSARWARSHPARDRVVSPSRGRPQSPIRCLPVAPHRRPGLTSRALDQAPSVLGVLANKRACQGVACQTTALTF
jgi:hypothetical protein